MRPRWAQERHTHTGLVGGGDGFLPVKDSLRFQARASTAGGDSLEVTSGTGSLTNGSVSSTVADIRAQPRTTATAATTVKHGLYVKTVLNFAALSAGATFRSVFGLEATLNANTRGAFGFLDDAFSSPTPATPMGTFLSSDPTSGTTPFVGVVFDAGGDWHWYDNGASSTTGITPTENNALRLTMEYTAAGGFDCTFEDLDGAASSTATLSYVPLQKAMLAWWVYADGATAKVAFSRSEWTMEW